MQYRNVSQWAFETDWWHIPIILLILLAVVTIIALLTTSFYTIHKVNYLIDDLQQMDETFLKTLSEHDRAVLEQCVRLSNEQTKEQVTKLWDIYLKKEKSFRKNETRKLQENSREKKE